MSLGRMLLAALRCMLLAALGRISLERVFLVLLLLVLLVVLHAFSLSFAS